MAPFGKARSGLWNECITSNPLFMKPGGGETHYDFNSYANLALNPDTLKRAA